VARLAEIFGPVTRLSEPAVDVAARLRREELVRTAAEELRALHEAGGRLQ
jgi:hypothetical protein